MAPQAAWLAFCLFSLGVWGLDDAAEQTEDDPYLSMEDAPFTYTGPGRDEAAPLDLTRVKIGLYGPKSGPRSHHGGQMMRWGVELALEQANAGGGFHGLPFALVHAGDDAIWGSAREAVALVYDEKVWAMVGSMGGQSTHIAEQIITKARVPLIAPASTDASLNQICIPWMFRTMPDDAHLAQVLVNAILQTDRHSRVQVLHDPGYDSRCGAQAVVAQMRLHAQWVEAWSCDDVDLDVQGVLEANPGAVVLWTMPEPGAAWVRALRAAKPDLLICGGPALVSDDFLAQTNDAAEGALLVSPCDSWRKTPTRSAFEQAFTSRFGRSPDIHAAFAYDSSRMLVQAIRMAGLNRAKIRDALFQLTHDGVTGMVRFDGTGANPGHPVPVLVRRAEDGKLVFRPFNPDRRNHPYTED